MATLPAAGHWTNAARTEGEWKADADAILAALKQIPGAGVAVQSLTIASGSATPADGASGDIKLDTEGAAATDDLTNLAQTNIPDGSYLMIRNANAARVVVVKHSAGGSGQISLATGGDVVLADPSRHWLLLKRNGTLWEEVFRVPDADLCPSLTKTANYTTTAADRSRLIDCTSGTFTLTLLALASAGVGFVQWVKNSGTGVVTIDPNSSETIDGGTTLALNPGDEIGFSSETGGWKSFTRFVAAGTDMLGAIVNGSIEATVAGNVLTFALKTKSGGDPSSTDSVYVAFRHSTLTNGGYNIRRITSALSWSVSAGSTLGFTANQTSRIYGGLLDNAGTVEGFSYHPLSGLSLKGIDESALNSTTAEGGAGAADSAQVLYSATARSNVPLRVLGYVDIQTGATAGNWSNSPTKKQTMGPGVSRTGDVLQQQFAVDSALFNSSTGIPLDDTIPQNTEGAEMTNLAVTVTPMAAVNILQLEALLQTSHNTATAQVVAALFQDSVANALSAAWVTNTNGGDQGCPLQVQHRMVAGTTSSTTFKARVGPSTGGGGQINVNGISGARRFGGVLYSHHRVMEICL